MEMVSQVCTNWSMCNRSARGMLCSCAVQCGSQSVVLPWCQVVLHYYTAVVYVCAVAVPVVVMV